MANKKISELPSSGALTGAELVEVVQGGINKQTTAQGIADLGGGHVIEDEGTPLPQRSDLNFVGAGVTATDAGGKTVVTIPGGGAVDSVNGQTGVVDLDAGDLTGNKFNFVLVNTFRSLYGY